jgi:hypothetical protein
MGPRVSDDLLLVGSLPAESTDEALRCCGELLGDVVFALPDGETGERQAWVAFEAAHLFAPHPDIEEVQPQLGRFNLWDAVAFRLRPGTEAITYERLPRTDVALESYRRFRELKDAGEIPQRVRFQLSLPSPASAFGWFFRGRESMVRPLLHQTADFEREYAIHERAYEAAWSRELERLLAVIPAEELAIQWDICFEVLDLERLFAYTSADGAWERFAGPVGRMSRDIPPETLVGYHLCYGTFPEWPMREADDMGLLVEMANTCIETCGRAADWVHLAGPRHLRSHDDAFFRPLQRLRAPSTKVFLGLIHPIDGEDGLVMRTATARRYLEDFGVALYCGFGRSQGETARDTLRAHRAAYDLFAAS